MYCPIKVVIASLATRKIKVNTRGIGNGVGIRMQLRDVLQLEQELTRMTMHMRDQRFKSSHASAKSVPLDRLIICVLHCPMRTHEKVITLLLQQACQNRLPNKSVPILDDKLKDTWNYEWLTGAKCVSKIKLPWDQSALVDSCKSIPNLTHRQNKPLAILHDTRCAHCIQLRVVQQNSV